MTGRSSFQAVLASMVIGFLALTIMVSLVGSQCCIPSVDIYPKILCPSGIEEKWVTAYIELPPPEDVYDINISSILLNSIIPINPDAGTKIGDYDEDARLDLMVKFDGDSVRELLSVGSVELEVSGSLTGGPDFEGSDVVTVIDGGK